MSIGGQEITTEKKNSIIDSAFHANPGLSVIASVAIDYSVFVGGMRNHEA